MQTDRAMRYVHGLHCLRSTTNRSCISQSWSGTFLLGSTTLRSLYSSILLYAWYFRGHFVICICPCLAWIDVASVKHYLNAIKAKQSASNARKRAVVELERYSWPTCSKESRRVVGVANKLRRRRILSIRDRLAVAKFSKPRVWDKFAEGSTFILEIPELSYNTAWDRSTEASMLKSAGFFQLRIVSFRYNTGLWQTDGRTDTWRQHIPR